MQFSSSRKQRRPLGAMNSISTNFLHLRNPYVIAWWSAAFPGFAHLSLGSYIAGFLLFTWEMTVNFNASLNLAILYSFTGRFEMAKEIVNNRWLLLYAPVFIYCIWNGYQLTVDLNKLTILAQRNESKIDPERISFYEINALDRRIPWVSVAWTFLTPGLGHLYTHRTPTAFFLLIWWIVVCYFSHILQSIQFTALGLFDEAKAILNPQWLIYMPSIFGFALYDVYVNTVEYNRLFEQEQAKMLEQEYQDPAFKMPVRGGDKMHVVASFEHSLHLELAITDLEQKGIEQGRICAIPLSNMKKERQLFDNIHRSDGESMFDIPTILGTILMVLGVLWGFMWKWGPIIWGLIGLFIGMAVGFAFKYFLYIRNSKNIIKGKDTEVVVVVDCKPDEVKIVEDIFCRHLAIGIGVKK
ncbi:MAG: hypothetical protein K0R55_4361 [Sporomusa sp.]|nr:hypothetical protein [Sporomusa sp.]